MSMHEVNIESGQPVHIHYEDDGVGKPLVPIHGWPLSGRSWEAQVPARSAAGHRVVKSRHVRPAFLAA